MSVKPSMPVVFGALVKGLDGSAMPDGSILGCSSKFMAIDKVSDANLPFLVLRSGSFQSNEWDRFQTQVVWDIAGELKTKSDADNADVQLQTVIEGIFDVIGRLRGLYVDDSLNVYSYSDQARALYTQGALTSLAFRGGPFLTRAATRGPSDSPYRTADITLRIEFITDHDPTASTWVTPSELIIGAIPVASDGSYPIADPYADYKYRIPQPFPDSARQGFGLFSDNTYFPPGTVKTGPLAGTNPKFVKGQPYHTLIKDLNVSPQAPTMAHTGTLQLGALGIQIDGVGQILTNSATWISTDPTKATVNSAGLVTGVAAGTTTITASYGGASGSTVITLT